MATRYFKRDNDREVGTTSSGNRRKVRPDTPGYPYDWVEIERKEFTKLRQKIISGRTPAPANQGDTPLPQDGASDSGETCTCKFAPGVPPQKENMSALDQVLSIPSIEIEHPRLHTDAYLELHQLRLHIAKLEAAQHCEQWKGKLSGLLEGEYKVNWVSDDVVYLTPRR